MRVTVSNCSQGSKRLRPEGRSPPVVNMKSLTSFSAIAACAVAALALIFTPVAAFSPQAAQAKWWQSDTYKKELVLTAEQVRRIEDVFQKALPKLKAQKSALDEAEA